MTIWDWLITCIKFVIMGLLYYVTGQLSLALLYYFLLVGCPLACLRVFLCDEGVSATSLLLHTLGLDLLPARYRVEV